VSRSILGMPTFREPYSSLQGEEQPDTISDTIPEYTHNLYIERTCGSLKNIIYIYIYIYIYMLCMFMYIYIHIFMNEKFFKKF